jgi:hypothetical protein
MRKILGVENDQRNNQLAVAGLTDWFRCVGQGRSATCGPAGKLTK